MAVVPRSSSERIVVGVRYRAVGGVFLVLGTLSNPGTLISLAGSDGVGIVLAKRTAHA
jgi:hypothetical protein